VLLRGVRRCTVVWCVGAAAAGGYRGATHCTGHDCFMETTDAAPHGVVTCRIVIVVMARSGACGTGVAVIDVAAVGVAVVHVFKTLDWVWRGDLGGRRSSWHMLSALISPMVAALVVLVIVVIVALVVRWRIHGWASHEP